MSITLTALQKQRRDTAANWTTANPTLLAGEIGLESDTGYWKVGDGSTAWTSLAYVPGLGAEIPVSRLADGTARQLLQTAANGTDVEWTSNVDVPGTLDVTGVATFDNNVIVQGDLTVNGTTTTIDTTNLAIEDKNIEIGKVATPTDVTADGGGITLKGTTDKTINWVDATDAWTFSEHINIASGKEYRIAGAKVLDATSLGSAVVSSSLTSVGTIGTGTWQGTAINKTYLDSTLVSTGDTGTVTSTMIANGTIVNADINASAAIAGTKISPDFGSQNTTTTGTSTAASFIPTSSTAPTNGVYLPAANSVAISTNGAGRLFVNSSGQVGIGTSSPGSTLDVSGTIRAGGTGISPAFNPRTTTGNTAIQFTDLTNTKTGYLNYDNNNLIYYGDGAVERLRVDSSGRLGIGTTSPGAKLHVAAGGSTVALQLDADTGSNTSIALSKNGSIKWYLGNDQSNDGFRFYDNTAASERARIDSSGRLLVGTSSTSVSCTSIFQGNPAGYYSILLLAANTATPTTTDPEFGQIRFTDNTHTAAASIIGARDGGTWSGSSKPSRLVFSTTADGASSPTTRLTIASNGDFRIANTGFVHPVTDNAVSLGLTGFRWSAVWAANGTIQTSDQRAKVDITNATLGSDFIKALRPVSYKWIEGGKRDTGERDEDNNYIYESVPGTRTHWGFIAQEVKQVVDESGVDFGGWILTDKDDPDSAQGLRYDQFIAPLTKALQETMAELEALKAEVAALKA